MTDITNAQQTRLEAVMRYVCDEVVRKSLRSRATTDLLSTADTTTGARRRALVKDVLEPKLATLLGKQMRTNIQKLVELTAKPMPSLNAEAIEREMRKQMAVKLGDEAKHARTRVANNLREARGRYRALCNQLRALERRETRWNTVEEHARMNTASQLRRARNRVTTVLNLVNAGIPKPTNDYENTVLVTSRVYGPIPEPIYDAPLDAYTTPLPETSAIYFIWDGDNIVYVGRSIQLSKRLVQKGHHILKSHHRVSYVLVDRHNLAWAEMWYIGLCRPPLNREGQMAREVI